MIENGKFIQTVIAAIFSLCVTGLMMWLGWITVVMFDHNRQIMKIEFLEHEINQLKSTQP